MRAYVTGGTGFLGTHLVRELDRKGWKTTVLHRKTSDLSELKRLTAVEFAEGDILDLPSILRSMPEGVDAVFHCAASVGTLPHAEEGSRYRVNQEGTRNIVDACLDLVEDDLGVFRPRVVGGQDDQIGRCGGDRTLFPIHISEPTRQAEISYAVFCLKKKIFTPLFHLQL